jgi:hypothetical protein
MFKLADVWWCKIPGLASRFSRQLGIALCDGFYLLRWPKVAAYAPPAVLVLGLLLGAIRLFPGETFTFSLLLIALFLVPASFGAGLGAWLTIGYAIGDFIFFRPRMVQPGLLLREPLPVLTRVGLPALILYVLLAGLLVGVPLVSAGLRLQVLNFVTRMMQRTGRLKRGPHRRWMAVAAAPIQGVLQATLVYVWIHNVPTLIRPVYTWIGSIPPVPAMAPLQNHGDYLVWLAAALGTVRVLLEYRHIQRQDSTAAIARVLQTMMRVKPRSEGVFIAIPRVLFKAVFITFMLSGLILSISEGVFLLVLVLAGLAIREVIIPSRPALTKAITDVPVLIRLIGGSVASYVLSTIVMRLMWDNAGQSFRPLVAGVPISLLIFAIVLPGPPRDPAKNGAQLP